MQKTVAQKMGLKEGMRGIFLHAPVDAISSIEIPALDLKARLSGEFQYIHLFVKTQAVLDAEFKRVKKYLAAGGALWVSWPKGKPAGADLDIKSVIHTGYEHGLVESVCLSVNKTWSALKFTHPKKGKIYNNSYGTLPGQ